MVIGVLSALPIISAGNVCCCLWVVIGGVVAAHLLQQNQDAPLAPGDGALVGLMAGAFGAIVWLVLSIPISILIAPVERALLQRLVDTTGSMPPEFRDYVGGYVGSAIGLAVGFVFMLFVSPMFATLGGLLGVALLRKQAPHPAPPPAS